MGRSDEEAIRLMGGFGGGMGRSGSVCGAISGGIAALSLVYRGKGGIDEEANPKLPPLCGELYRRFGQEIETSQQCRDIIGMDLSKEDQLKLYYNSPDKRARCARLVTKTAEMVREMMTRDSEKPTTGT